jgi:hypothetical protein
MLRSDGPAIDRNDLRVDEGSQERPGAFTNEVVAGIPVCATKRDNH